MIEAVHGVLLDAEDTAVLLDALDVFEQVLAGQGSQPGQKLVVLKARISAAHSRSVSRLTRVDRRNAGAESDSGDDLGHEVIDTARAAAILGISADGVRDLARRGRIPCRRVGGRWLLSATAVVARAGTR